MKLEDKIFLSITTHPKFSWKHKIQEADFLGLNDVAVFVTYTDLSIRKQIYKALEKSKIKHIPLVHIRDDFEKWEFEFFYDRYGTRLFNCHINAFPNLSKWRDFQKYLYLEYDYFNQAPKLTKLDNLKGLCIDFSHLWSAKDRNTIEYYNMVEGSRRYKIGCNHLNGYSYRLKRECHYVSDLSQFDYLKEIPKKYFSSVIALEVNNSLKKQLEFKQYIINLLANK